MIDRTSAANIQSMLETIRAYQSQAATGSRGLEETTAPKTQMPSFTDSVKKTLHQVKDAKTKPWLL